MSLCNSFFRIQSPEFQSLIYRKSIVVTSTKSVVLEEGERPEMKLVFVRKAKGGPVKIEQRILLNGSSVALKPLLDLRSKVSIKF